MRNKARKILQNKDVKSLLENFLSLSFIQVLNLVLPLVTLPYIIKVVGLEKYGLIILATTLISYFYTICDYSFKITATRDVVLYKNSSRKLSFLFSKVTYIKTLLLLFSVIVVLSVVYLYQDFREHSLIFFFTLIGLIGNTYFPDWFFQGIEKMKYISISNLFIKGLFTILVFVFIKKEEDYWLYPLFFSLGYLLSTAFAYFILFRKYKVGFVKIKTKELKRTIKKSFPIFVNQFLPTLYNNTSTLFLGIFVGVYWVGIYDAVKKIVDLFSALMGIVSRVFYPFLNRKKEAFSVYKKLSISMAFFFALIPVIFYQYIMNYLNIDYEKSFLLIFILSVGFLFLALYDIFGLNYFIVNRKDKVVMKNTIISSVIGLILIYPLVHFLGIIGAALNLTISRGFMGLNLYFQYLKDEKNNK